jgi:GDP-L-fucose synthase
MISKIKKTDRIFVAGHRGMVGSSIVRRLKSLGYDNIITRTHRLLDLTRQKEVRKFFWNEKPKIVIDCAALVGGIYANNEYRGDFIYNNLQIQNNLIHYSKVYKVKKLLFLGSSCIYPKFTDQPIKEEYLLRSPLEYTNEPYAIAKIAGIKMCESYYRQFGCDFLSVMPCNLYGPYDNFDLKNSHVLPALIRKAHEAKINKENINVWGTGKACREFLHVDDLASACVHLLENVDAKDIYDMGISHINIGSGEEISIKKLAETIADVVGYERGWNMQIKFDLTQPDGTLKKLMDISRLQKLGWRAKIGLTEGLKSTYEWYRTEGIKKKNRKN